MSGRAQMRPLESRGAPIPRIPLPTSPSARARSRRGADRDGLYRKNPVEFASMATGAAAQPGRMDPDRRRVRMVGVVFIARSGAKKDGNEHTSTAGKLLYPFIIVAGMLMAIGVVWNAQLRGALMNPWLAATVSFVPVLFVFAFIFLLRATPLPTRQDLQGVRWWMPLAGLTGAVAVFGGLLFVDKVGAGAFNGAPPRGRSTERPRSSVRRRWRAPRRASGRVHAGPDPVSPRRAPPRPRPTGGAAAARRSR